MSVGRITRRTLVAGAVSTIALRSASAAGSRSAVLGPAVASAPPRRINPPTHARPGWTSGTIGTSAAGRPIVRLDSRPDRPTRHIVVICGIHGDERAASDLADAFGRIHGPADVHLTIVPSLNPDGWAANTRRNDRGVDLNRNFPWGWPRLPTSGAHAASEPETKAAMDFLAATRPDLVIWVHQPLGYVAAIPGCPNRYADLWSEIAEVPVRHNVSQVGGGETWAGRELGIPSMLVEVDGSHQLAVGTSAHALALEALAFEVQPP